METTMQEVTLSVPDISCDHCARTINGALSKVSGVATSSVDIPARTVWLRFQPAEVSLEAIEAALDEEGYPVAK